MTYTKVLKLISLHKVQRQLDILLKDRVAHAWHNSKGTVVRVHTMIQDEWKYGSTNS
jgi:hypothetical protein